MTSRAESFDALYRADPDPWRFETSAYEAQKYDATMAALPAATYANGLEIGCSIGVLTARLAARCGQLTAVDVSSVALAAARTRCHGAPVTFLEADVPAHWPDGRYDLIVFSEVLYFLERAEIEACACLACAAADGTEATIVLVNYLGPCDRPLDGAASAELFVATAACAEFVATTASPDPRYRIDVLRRQEGEPR